jgi:hypothetical protein
MVSKGYSEPAWARFSEVGEATKFYGSGEGRKC